MLKLVKFKPQKKRKSFCQKFLISKGKIRQILEIGGREGRGGEGQGNFITFSHTL
jgi:hypothetical protein